MRTKAVLIQQTGLHPMELHIHICSNPHAVLLARIGLPPVIASVCDLDFMAVFLKMPCQIRADSSCAGHTADCIHQ